MALSPIYALTDPVLLPGKRLISGVARALDAGITTIQFRDKHRDDEAKLPDAIALRELCETYGAALIINDSIELALACSAHGVHLGQQDEAVASARERMGASAIIGATCHHAIDFGEQAVAAGADYLAFGRFFHSTTKPHASPASLEVLQQARARFANPIVAIGGINADNMTPLIRAGAHSLAVCHSIFGVEDIHRAASGMLDRFRTIASNNPQN